MICEECKWWDNETNAHADNEEVGICRHHGPSFFERMLDNDYQPDSNQPWSHTWSTDWCGEFESK